MPTTGRLSEGSDPSWAGIRSLTTAIHLDTPFASSRTKPVSVRLPVDECRKFERLNVTVAEGYWWTATGPVCEDAQVIKMVCYAYR